MSDNEPAHPDNPRHPTVTKINGHWHVRWCDEQWIQWPVGCEATKKDAFGWVSDKMIELANIITMETPRVYRV